MKTYERRLPFHKCQEKGSVLADVCRLCLNTSNETQNIFAASDEVSLPMKIMACVSVQVWEGDGLPCEICFECLTQLVAFFKFRQKCQEADNKIHAVAKKFKGPQPRMSSPEKERRNKSSVGVADEDLQRASSVSDLSPEFHDGNVGAVVVVSSCDFSLHNTSVTTSGLTNLPETSIYDMENIEYNAEKSVPSNLCSSKTKTGKCKSNDTGQSNGMLVEESQNQSKTLSAHSNYEGKAVLDSSLSLSRVHYETETCDDPQSQNMTDSLVFKCEKCLKGFARRIDLKRHSSVHDEQRGFVCSVCEKWFPDKFTYKRHENVHTMVRPFRCSYCQKCFSQESILSRHLTIHTGEKTYKCEACSRTFVQRQALQVHARTHLNQGTPQFPCPLCNKSFCHESGLSRHLLAHTGKKFECLICSKLFSDQSSQKRHSKRHVVSRKKQGVIS